MFRFTGRSEVRSMPMSAEAFAGLRAVVEWNPLGPRLLLGILREHPTWVRYKDDPNGPLHLVQHVDEPMRVTSDGRLVPSERTPFPVDQAGACEGFGREWLRRDFSKSDLAEAIAGVLVALPNEGGGGRR